MPTGDEAAAEVEVAADVQPVALDGVAQRVVQPGPLQGDGAAHRGVAQFEAAAHGESAAGLDVTADGRAQELQRGLAAALSGAREGGVLQVHGAADGSAVEVDGALGDEAPVEVEAALHVEFGRVQEEAGAAQAGAAEADGVADLGAGEADRAGAGGAVGGEVLLHGQGLGVQRRAARRCGQRGAVEGESGADGRGAQRDGAVDPAVEQRARAVEPRSGRAESGQVAVAQLQGAEAGAVEPGRLVQYAALQPYRARDIGLGEVQRAGHTGAAQPEPGQVPGVRRRGREQHPAQHRRGHLGHVVAPLAAPVRLPDPQGVRFPAVRRVPVRRMSGRRHRFPPSRRTASPGRGAPHGYPAGGRIKLGRRPVARG
ncbi:hypothetical protein ACLMNJ_34175 [Streptomyces seoulensis]